MSGRKRLAIARALIGNPRILIFDEATSALDYDSERMVQQNIQRICRGRTVIFIVHLLTVVRHADCILVMERAEIVEQGAHDALLALLWTWIGQLEVVAMLANKDMVLSVRRRQQRLKKKPSLLLNSTRLKATSTVCRDTRLKMRSGVFSSRIWLKLDYMQIHDQRVALSPGMSVIAEINGWRSISS